MDELAKIIVNNGAGVAALLVVFWVILKELPAQRAARESADKLFSNTLIGLTSEFRKEMQDERTTNSSDREKDREAHSRLADAVTNLNVKLVEIMHRQ